MRPDDARRGRRDGVGVEQPAGTLDGDEQAHAARGHSHFGLAAIQNLLDELHLVRALHLGQDQSLEARPDDGGQVGVHALVPDRVDPHVAGRRPSRNAPALRARRDLVERGGDLPAGRLFRRRGDAVFDIHHDGVHREAQRLVDHALAIARHEHPRTQSCCRISLLHIQPLSLRLKSSVVLIAIDL